jgi:NDP-sugar pyrophosphorylase family protein
MSFPASTLFDWPKSLEIFSHYFSMEEEPWLWLPKIEVALKAVLPTLSGTKQDIPPGVVVGKNVYIHPSVDLPHMATILDNVYIGEGTKLKPGAYIRQNVIIGARCTVGNSCELKNAILMESVQASHFNYIGDSILGNGSHLGAGAILANLRFDKQAVVARTLSGMHMTNLKKVGAFVGDGAELGCNSVLQPGTVLGRNACIMPTLAYGGFLEANCMAFAQDSKVATVPRKRV